MTPLLASLRAAGFALSAAPDGGLIVSPASKLTPEQRAQIAAHRSELLGAILDPPLSEDEFDARLRLGWRPFGPATEGP